jgi:DNA-binding transcriptional ArsR family regulator
MGKPKAGRLSRNGAQHLQKVRQAAILLKQVSDPTRLQVISMLSQGEMFVGEVCRALDQGQPAVSHHLALLRNGGIIEPRRQGQNTFYTLTEKGDLLASVVKEINGKAS